MAITLLVPNNNIIFYRMVSFWSTIIFVTTFFAIIFAFILSLTTVRLIIKNVTEGHPHVGDMSKYVTELSEKSPIYNIFSLHASVTNIDRFRLLVMINLRSTFLINSKKITNIMFHVYLLFGAVTLSLI